MEAKRLNKFIADSGYCSRREADRLIAEGRVRVDGRVGALGDQVRPGMRVEVDGKPLSGRGERVYLAVGRLIDGRAEFRHQRPVAHGADGKACHKNPPLALPGKTKNAA